MFLPKDVHLLVHRLQATVRLRSCGSYPETVLQLEKRLARCHPTNREDVQAELEQARNARGLTVFDWLVEIISIHGAGGAEAQDGIELVLA